MRCQHIFHSEWKTFPGSDLATHLLVYATAPDLTIAVCPTCMERERGMPDGRISEIVSVD